MNPITPAEARTLKPIEQIYHIFPSQAESVGWQNPSRLIERDVQSAGLLQEFTDGNSATLLLPTAAVSTPPIHQSAEPPVNNASSSSSGEGEVVPSELTDPPLEDIPEPSTESPPAEPAPAVEEPAPSDEVQPVTQNFLERATERYLFMQATVDEPSVIQTSVDLEIVEPEVNEPSVDTESVSADAEVVPSSLDTAAAGAEATVDGAEAEIPPPALERIEAPENSITLDGFGLPDLVPGEYIEDVRLLVSLAGDMRTGSEGAILPSIQASYTIDSFAGVAGSILLDGEVSNAMNGDYYVLSFPSISDPALLKNLKITLSFDGDIDTVRELYIDAVWLEVATESFTKQLINERKDKLPFAHLAEPQFSELLSPQLNFGRYDEVRFNFKYESQRNVIVRTARQLLGRDLAKIQSAEFIHQDLGDVGIVPTVTVTNDGLMTVQMSEDDRERLRPGQYTLELAIDEGGKVFNESFDFQWGMLSLNPSQSEYGVGETVEVSLGALSPNGNTVCNAELDLFVIAPDESVVKVPVVPSGLCSGNNVVAVPDYTAQFASLVPGTYEMYLERLDEFGEVMGYTSDTFLVAAQQSISLERGGPTRINPLSPYTMELTVRTHGQEFDGRIVERVPNSFTITATDAEVVAVGDWQELIWPLDLSASSSRSLSYEFDAPNISPYLFTLGPARLETEAVVSVPEVLNESVLDEISPAEATSTESSSADELVPPDSESETVPTDEPAVSEVISRADTRPLLALGTVATIVFEEHREWQLASDAVGNMILYWDSATTIPSGWTCLSCGSGTFFQKFAVGSSTYNTTGGALTHTHAASGTVAQTASGTIVELWAGTNLATNDHAHTYTPTIATASNLPSYRTLRVIQYSGGAGEPPTLPTGAIAIFDTTVPSGWTRYTAQDGYYVYGENTVGTTGGANSHTHAISGTVGASTGVTGQRGGTPNTLSINAAHTHTVSSTSNAATPQVPYLEVILGKITATSTPPVGMISMWSEEVPAGWIDVSSAPSAAFNGRFIKASSTYGGVGGSATHAHTDKLGMVSSAASAGTTAGRTAGASTGAVLAHTHLADATNFTTVSNLPPYLTAVFGKRIGLDPVFEQSNYRWYTNTNAQAVTDPWSAGVAIELAENEPVSALNQPISNGEIIRLRLNAEVGNATSTVGTLVKLQFAAASVCTSATGWTDVGAVGSGSVWRGYNNTSVTDNSTLSSTLLASSTASFSYQENGTATGTPNAVGVGGFGEWDFVLQNNSATAGAEYCFRLVYSDNSLFFAYDTYPQLITNGPPNTHALIKRFSSENATSTLPTFDFYATDPEGDAIDYQIQIASDYAFSSVVVDRNSISNSTQFENQVLTSEKAPFTNGQTIRFTNTTALTNGVTYWWRIRGQDTDASGTWGDWSTADSFTVTTSLTAAGWLQTEDEQFAAGTLTGVEVYGSDQVRLITGSTTGTIVSPVIDFADGDVGTAWDQLRFTNNVTTGSIRYQIEYRNTSDVWSLISNTILPGNTIGFSSTSSPVSLLSLDTSVYRYIRVVATLTNSGGTPYLQDWAIDWGFRVETPTISAPFPNEKVSTTTPTFTVATNDPQNDSLTYQIEWSTSSVFATGVTTRTSGTHSGFINLDDGIDTDPFNSGDPILFTIQGADALIASTTYWWRVRAKDTTGDNEYSFWTDAQSFTVDGSVVASTWFQTTAEQFESNILSGTTGVSGGVTVATVAEEALIVYGEGTVTTPRYRLWDGAAWSTEADLLDINSTTRWVVTQAGTTREEYIAGTVGTNGYLIAQVYALGAWGNKQTMTTTIGSTATRGFDIGYETTSGDALVVFCDSDANPAYRVWNGSAWSAETAITSALSSNCRWVELASDPTSDELVVVIRGSADTPYEALVWNGSAWGNSSTFGTARVATYSGVAVAYEESGGQAIAVAPSPGGAGNRMVYNAWNGTAWTGATTQTIGGRLYWGDLTANVGTDELALCYINDVSEVRAIRWTGSAWASDTLFTATVNASTDPAYACVYENGGGRDNYIVGAYSDTTQTNYRTWNTTTWSTATTVNSIGRSATMQLARTGSNTILGTFFDYLNTSLRFASWTGSAWSSTQTLEDSTSVTSSPYGLPYYIAPRNPGSSGSVVVSPAIVFTDGQGPYWQQFSWNHTLPGASTIVYKLQYYNGTTWQFIPNAALSGNESGYTTSPIDLSGLNVTTYGTIRPYAELSCDGSSNCPTINDWTVRWAEGISISGTIQQYDQSTNVTSGTVAVAVNGVLQVGKTGTIAAGVWTIPNVTAFAGDVITVYVTGAADVNEAVGVVRYNGTLNVTGLKLFERHLAVGSNATTTPLTNADIGQYDFTNTEDIFANVTSGTLQACAEAACADVRLSVPVGAFYSPTGRIVTHDVDNKGTFTAGAYTHDVSGSWLNTGTTTMTGSTVVMTATSTTESIDTTSAVTRTFNNLTFGTTTGAATWVLSNQLDVSGALTVTRGTLNRGAQLVTIGGTLSNEAAGTWTGIGTTTFSGSGTSNWRDLNSTLQNVGHILVDGTAKSIVLTGNVKAESLTIGVDDVLDVSTGNYGMTIVGNWLNQNNFLARQGTVTFTSTSTNRTITTGASAFYNTSFNGAGGSWSFTQNALTISNNLTIATGTVTLPSATTTVGGSWNSTGGTFAHNNGEVRFTSNAAQTITVSGGMFTNSFYDMRFTGNGTWGMTDSATTSRHFTIVTGTVTLPPSTLAVGGSFAVTTGSFAPAGGTVNFYGGSTRTIGTNGVSFANLLFTGAGASSFTSAAVTALGDVVVQGGAVTLPTTTLSIGGSYTNSASIVPGAGEVVFTATSTGKTVQFGSSSLYNVRFAGTGAWTITGNASTTNNFNLATVGTWTLQSGATLSVGGSFTSSVGGASTTWTGSTLSLEAGTSSINTKTAPGDAYATLRVATGAHISMWNSVASSYAIAAASSLYSQDHNGANGSLAIFGNYVRSSGSEHWSYATDFDGTSLSGGSERAVQVTLADTATVQVNSALLSIVGSSSATTTIANQGSGTYSVAVSGGTTTAQYFAFTNLGATGVSLLSGTVVTSLDDGVFIPSVASGTGLTLSSTTINANPAKQLFRVQFATTTVIAATNVTQIDGTPVSYWWFRNGSGNLNSEANDNDTGDPGSVRFDDSSLPITISGTVYSDAGLTPLVGGTCDGSTPVVRVVVQGTTAYTGSCSNVDGSFSVPGIVVVGDPVVTVYLDGASGGEKAAAVTRTPTGDITDLDLYVNRVIVRNEDAAPLSIAQLAVYDSGDDADLSFTAATGTTPLLTTAANTELYVWSGATFAPAGDVVVAANGQANSYDGTLFLAATSTFTASATGTYTVGGRFVQEAGAVFMPASSTVILNATTTGKSVTAGSLVNFYNVQFTGVGGAWNLGAPLQVAGDMQINAGTVTGTSDITLTGGSLTGNGLLSLGAGTTTLTASPNIGGTSSWTFFNLALGNGLIVGTTTPLFTATTTISGVLTIANAHFLAAGSTVWDLAGSGTVFSGTGTFIPGASTVRYSGATANVSSRDYYNLDINAGAGTPTYTATGLGMSVGNDLTVGGQATTVFTLDTSDVVLDVAGDVIIRPNGTLVGSNSAALTVAGDWQNSGAFTSSGGTLTFDGTGTSAIAAGNSSFSSVVINGTGTFTVTTHATATVAWALTNHSAFTLGSGQTLAVGGTFTNSLGGGATTWTGSTLALYGGANYTINTASTTDTYDTLAVRDTTQIRMWNSAAGSYSVASTASLYSQDHAATNGALSVFGAYTNTTRTDYWSYATDFDGAALGGSARAVTVNVASGGSVNVGTGGALMVIGGPLASTTVTNQGSGNYGLSVTGGTTNWSYYVLRYVNSAGLALSGSPTVTSLAYGDIEVDQTGGSGLTVAGSVITANPAKTLTSNRFALGAAASGYNVTVTGTTVSSWRFTNHTGALAGEGFDNDPNGDPGYVVWDDSAALITVSGNVYSDEGSTASPHCDGVTSNVVLRVAGLTSYTTSCAAGTGAYSISNVAFGPTDTLTVYLDNETEKAVTVTANPISSISNLDLYERRVIVRHEGVDPLSIAQMSVWDSSDDADIPFTAVDASPDTLTVPANHKVLIWTSKTFEPNGNVTLSGAGAGAAYDGTLEAQANARFRAVGVETHSIGGSLIFGAGAEFVSGQSTTSLTTTGSARTVDINEAAFYNIAFTGSGSWVVTDTTFTASRSLSQSAGVVTFPVGTTTIGASFNATGGSFTMPSSLLQFVSTTTGNVVRFDDSLVPKVRFTGNGGAWAMTDTNATTTGSFEVVAGTVTLVSGNLAVAGSFQNTAGTVIHNTADLLMSATTSVNLQASSSSLFAVRFVGSGPFTMVDTNLTLMDSLAIASGTVTFASGTLSVAGDFDATGGTFSHASGTVLFNATAAGKVIALGSSPLYNVVFGSATGGWTVNGNATTTNNLTLSAAAGFTKTAGTTLTVGGVFTNLVGGAATTWVGTTLQLGSGTGYTINTKTQGDDLYGTVQIGSATALRSWNSSAATTTITDSSSWYSQDHAGVDGNLNIYGNLTLATTTEYWSYATDFDGTALGGSARAVTVRMASNATTTIASGVLNMLGIVGNETTVTNQGAGTYTLALTGGTLNADYYAFRNLAASGLTISGTPLITSLSHGDFELAVSGGSLLTITAEALNTNASFISTGNRFATTTAITGTNITLVGTTSSAWTFVSHTGNLAGEAYDIDGATACGSVRWSNSVCLLTQQTEYRWRNDDGGEAVPSSEWFDTDWGGRKRVRVENPDATAYTNAVVKLTVAHDATMRSDFSDLRFTLADGLTPTSYFIETYTSNTEATVWVLVPSLPASDTATVFMYFDNAVATDASVATSTFTFAETFEGGSIPAAYSGDTGLFTVGTGFNYERTYGLDNVGNQNAQATDGIYRTDISIAQGHTFRYFQYIDTSTGSGDEVCTLFAIQTPGTTNDNYGVCLEQYGIDRVSLARDVIDRDASGVILASSTIAFTTGWYELEVDWRTDDEIVVRVYRDGALVTTISANDGTYTAGGVGYTYWFNHGGWDMFTARPYQTSVPTVRFGVTQGDGGASWAANQNAAANSFEPGDTARIRFAIENTGLAITGQDFTLEYAERGVSPSCEAVGSGSYVPVPPQASCGMSPLCMQTSTNVTNGQATTDLLADTSGDFIPGAIISSPSNATTPTDVAQDEYIELEYVVTPTLNVNDETLCLRVTDNGAELDTYLQVATLQLRFSPVFGAVNLNNGLPISLVPGTTTRVYATGTVTDLNGYADLTIGTSTIYRGGATPSCSADNNNCYISDTTTSCSFANCAGNTCELRCAADIYFHADPTDVSPYEGEEWLAYLEVSDQAGGYDFASALGVELYSLPALSVDSAINYGSLAVSDNTGAFNPTTNIVNLGNTAFDIEIDGTDLSDGNASVIPADQQKFATSTFTYSACLACSSVSSTTATGLPLGLSKPTAPTPPVSAPIYWGIAVPVGVNSAPHQGINVFTPVSI